LLFRLIVLNCLLGIIRFEFVADWDLWLLKFVASPKFGGTNIFNLGEHQRFVWNAASHSTKRQSMLEIWEDHGPLAPLATPMGSNTERNAASTLYFRVRMITTTVFYFPAETIKPDLQ